ncbi:MULTISPECIES: hypothetical protein [Spirulina sp. CCY15215]|nr:hypothetical protein [Spirulina major]
MAIAARSSYLDEGLIRNIIDPSIDRHSMLAEGAIAVSEDCEILNFFTIY